jgi:hypothetical protein
LNKVNVLFNSDGSPKTPEKITEKINAFEYNETTQKINRYSESLDINGDTFIKCGASVLTNFGMTRGGPFHGLTIDKSGRVKHPGKLQDCWNEVGDRIFEIRKSIQKSGYSRDRFLLELCESDREELITQIWSMTKRLLPFTMGATSYGLVGASKILFAVLPEIVLPVDNSMWLNVFKTVDLGDVIRVMVLDIQRWEKVTERKLNEMDQQNRLATLPSIYNVMAMAARPKKKPEDD